MDVATRMQRAAGIVATLSALAGCSAAGAEDAKSSASTPTSTARGVVRTPSAEGTGEGSAATLVGRWAPSGFEPLVLHVTGLRAELMGRHHCRGRVTRQDGVQVVRLKCDDGNTDRAVGRVYGLTASTMTIDWEGFGADSMRRIN
ncbi:hypothetical protein [Streptomyces sp. NBC_00198]|uniref:hypothetical protein n=1 Tax=unclassified Streptomyces TaxID=2593676 RepID=UPI00224E9024|nr:hypothetical protein [Streptomyces sp. NBC_00198]MCX5281473.1 hypothetical protein [Streptomyces sp. NBC_00198]